MTAEEFAEVVREALVESDEIIGVVRIDGEDHPVFGVETKGGSEFFVEVTF